MVCAWCSTLISRHSPHPGFEQNYGMCRACVGKQIARLAPRRRLRPLPARAARKRLRFAARPSYDSACSGESVSPRSG
jgi:hypothetical protein